MTCAATAGTNVAVGSAHLLSPLKRLSPACDQAGGRCDSDTSKHGINRKRQVTRYVSFIMFALSTIHQRFTQLIVIKPVV